MIKMLQIFAIGILIFIGSAVKVSAADSVGLSAMVVERKSYDTINDFNFSHIDTANKIENLDTKGSVKGVSTSDVDDLKNDASTVGFFALILSGLLFAIYKRRKKSPNRLHSDEQVGISIIELAQKQYLR